MRIGLSVDFLGNPIGLFNDITSGVTGVLTTTPDVMGLVRDVTHGMSDTTSKVRLIATVICIVEDFSTNCKPYG